MAVKGTFYGYPLATLQTMQTTWNAALTAIAINQSYSLAGRSLTRANLKDVLDTLAEIQSAIDRANGVRVTQTYTFFNSGYPNTTTGTP